MTKVSVIIPVYNEQDEIINCLVSLKSQTFTEFETIVVDDGSTDKTVERLNSVLKVDKNIKLLKQNHKGPGAARNYAAKIAKGKVLVFVDADMTFDKKFLQKLVAPILNGKLKGTFSKDEIVANWDNVWARCWNINQGFSEKSRHPKNYPDEQKVFRAILKSEFNKVGGFSPGGYTDDYSLYDKLGYKAVSVREAIFYHANPRSLGEVFHHAKWVNKREYKFGYLGMIWGLLRAILPVSLVVGLTKSIESTTYAFIIFKIVYDFGTIIGILELVLMRKRSK